MLKFYSRTAAMILVSLGILLISPTITKTTYQAETVSTPIKSAAPKLRNVMVATTVAQTDDRGKRLARFFASKNSPFVSDAEKFVQIADKYSLDYTLLPAITGVESSFGIHVPSGSFNPYGWNNGTMRFRDWVTSTEAVANGIRSRYARFGEVYAYAIGPRYAGDKTWASKVTRYQREIARY